VKIRRIFVPGHPRKKVCETPSQKIAGLGDVHLSPSCAGTITRRIIVQASVEKRTISPFPHLTSPTLISPQETVSLVFRHVGFREGDMCPDSILEVCMS
jgi:hypothetical protein